MFYDIKDQLNNINILQIMAYSLYDESIEQAKKKAKEYLSQESQKLYGWFEKDEIAGICGFIIHKEYVEILNIAVTKNLRNQGIGRNMITALRDKYNMVIEAETDDDAVNFYCKCGFKVSSAYRQIGDKLIKRWTCVLSIL